MSQKNCSCYLKIFFAFKLKIKILINLLIKNLLTEVWLCSRVLHQNIISSAQLVVNKTIVDDLLRSKSDLSLLQERSFRRVELKTGKPKSLLRKETKKIK